MSLSLYTKAAITLALPLIIAGLCIGLSSAVLGILQCCRARSGGTPNAQATGGAREWGNHQHRKVSPSSPAAPTMTLKTFFRSRRFMAPVAFIVFLSCKSSTESHNPRDLTRSMLRCLLQITQLPRSWWIY